MAETEPQPRPSSGGVTYEMSSGEVAGAYGGPEGGWPEFELHLTFICETDDMEAVERAARHALDEVYNRAGGRYVAP